MQQFRICLFRLTSVTVSRTKMENKSLRKSELSLNLNCTKNLYKMNEGFTNAQ